MFSRLPQSVTSPLGLLPDSQKLGFRSQPWGLSKLASVRHIAKTDRYWDQYVELFDSASEVFSLITHNDIRRALLEAPENIATLIRVICARLFNLITDHTFPTASNASAAFTSFMKSATNVSNRSATKEVLNCVRVLQRVLPVVFEVEGEGNAFETEILWKEIEIPDEEALEGETPQFIIEDDDDDSEDGEETDAAAADTSAGKKKRTMPSLGQKLFTSLFDLLFCCGFTIPTKLQKDHHKINYVIWEKGIGTTNDSGNSSQYDGNKTEVLRLLLVLLSRQIYVPPSSLFTKPSLYSLHIVQKTSRRDALTLLCSLLNTAMNATAASQVGIANMAGKLPYNHLVFKGEDPHTGLVTMCLQVLNCLLDFQSGTARDKIISRNGVQSISPTMRTNAFRYFLMKLHRTQDFDIVIEGVFGVIEQQMLNMNNVLPGSRKAIPYVTETVAFFWKMLELNKKFRGYVSESDKGTELVLYLLCYNVEIKDKPEQQGLCRALSYIFQTVSSEPSFGTRLGVPIRTILPSKMQTTGTMADFFINCIYSIVGTVSGPPVSLYPALIITLSNSAPYFRNIGVTTSTRLVQLFCAFSNPSFLLSDEGHPRLLFFMLEVFNNTIQHRLRANSNLTYAILYNHKVFEDLGTFTLARGIRRIEQAKEEANRIENRKARSRRTSAEQEAPHEEKSRLLREEGQEDEEDADAVSTELPTSTTPGSASVSGGTPISEKAKGKMRERRSTSSDITVDRAAAAAIGRNGFVPTQEWVTSWQGGLPLDPVMLLISELLPKMQQMQASWKTNSMPGIIDFLASADLSDVLPPQPPLSPRKFVWTDASIIWLTSMLWGEIYVRGITPLGIWNSTNVRLFHVKHSQNQPRQLTETVSHVVGGLLGRTTSETSLSRPRA